MSRSPAPIIVVGMQRSGTSALAGALSCLGVYFGKDEMLYAADSNNPQGYFEHRRATSLNLKILDEFQMHVTSFNSVPRHWKSLPQSRELRRLLSEYLDEEYGGHERWGLKQPLTSLVLPVYNDVFEELGISPRYVVCVRNPLEAMESESRLDFQGGYRVMQSLGTMAVGSWLRYTLGAITGAAPHPVRVVAYDDLLAEPDAVLRAIVDDEPEWEPHPKQWQRAVASIKVDLHHNRKGAEALEDFPAIVGNTYSAALTMARSLDSKEIAAAKRTLDELWREFEIWVCMMGDPVPGPGKVGLSWTDRGSQRVSERSFSVSGEFQTIELPVDAPPRTVVSGLMYGLPARVWIRRCVWKGAEQSAEAGLKCGPASQLTDVDGIRRLDAAFEPQQIQLVTPSFEGPYQLEIEFLIESGPPIHLATAARLASQLERCASEIASLRPRQ